MADRFPSIEDLDAGQTPTQTNGSGAEGGSFLDRERAALGEDADQFATAGEGAQTATVEDGDDDLLGGDFSGDNNTTFTQPSGGQEISDFESSFPAVDTQNDNVGPGGTITGSTLPYQPPTSGGYTNYSAPAEEEDTEPIRNWRNQRTTDLSRRDAHSDQLKSETTTKAREDLDSFYENYNKKSDRARTKVQEEATKFVESIDNTAAGGTAWERIAKLADVHKGPGGGAAKASGGGDMGNKDRMRSLMMDLAKDKNAPGAGGV
ncbi:MAG: hypothetical protein Q9160_002788 [Pyrenula sp. 1 TL-2023]